MRMLDSLGQLLAGFIQLLEHGSIVFKLIWLRRVGRERGMGRVGSALLGFRGNIGTIWTGAFGGRGGGFVLVDPAL